MKHYLIRAGFDPLKIREVRPDDYVWRNFIGGNSGNLMFAYGVMNGLQTDDVELEYTYNWSFTEAEINDINERFDAFVLPMADAFRPAWKNQLMCLTEAIRKMRIPVVVIGVAVRADYDADFTQGFEFDDAARDFVRAVVEKGTILGLRGDLSAKYLNHLGFTEDKEYQVIGCPSLYTYGLLSPINDKGPDHVSRLVVNTNGYYDIGNINEFLLRSIDGCEDVYLVQQQLTEFRDMYVRNSWLPLVFKKGLNKNDKTIVNGERLDRLYREDRVRFFFDVISWVNYMRQFDLFVGNRFHGCAAAVLSGIPHVMLPFNARTRELTEYHHLTSLKPDEIEKDSSVFDYLDKLDFHVFYDHQTDNLKRYIGFLEDNGLDHIFKKQLSYKRGESVLERRIREAISEPIDQYCYTVEDYDSLSRRGKVTRAVHANLRRIRKW